MRTPLAILRTNLEVVRSDPGATIRDYRDMSATLDRTLARLERLTSDLLTLSRGEGPIDAAPVPLEHLVQGIISDLQPLALTSQILLRQDLVRNVTVGGDEELLRRAVGNVIENGIRYNRPGGEVAIGMRPEELRAVISVADTGIGIPKESQARVFEPFHRVGQARDRRRGGAGLGLAMTNEIVRRHGGTIRLESCPDEGSTFTIALPLMHDDSPSRASHDGSVRQELRVT